MARKLRQHLLRYASADAMFYQLGASLEQAVGIRAEIQADGSKVCAALVPHINAERRRAGLSIVDGGVA